MKKLFKRLIAFTFVAALLFTSLAPCSNVFAATNTGSDSHDMVFKANSNTFAKVTVTVKYTYTGSSAEITSITRSLTTYDTSTYTVQYDSIASSYSGASGTITYKIYKNGVYYSFATLLVSVSRDGTVSWNTGT